MNRLSTTALGIFMLTQTQLMLLQSVGAGKVNDTQIGPIMRNALFDLVFHQPPLVFIDIDGRARLTSAGRKALQK